MSPHDNSPDGSGADGNGAEELLSQDDLPYAGGRGGHQPASWLGTAREVIERYSHCVICGSNLHFTHITDFSRNITQELAKCPECGVRARKATHSLQ